MTFKGIGPRIKKLRENRQMTQEEFGRFCGLSRPAIANYEQMGRIPATEEVFKIARANKVTMEWLLVGQETEETLKAANGTVVYGNERIERLSDEELFLVKDFRDLDGRDKTIVLTTINTLKNTHR